MVDVVVVRGGRGEFEETAGDGVGLGDGGRISGESGVWFIVSTRLRSGKLDVRGRTTGVAAGALIAATAGPAAALLC